MPLDLAGYYVEDEDGCWIWHGPRQTRGYGHKWCPDRKRNIGAHRLMWEQHRGPIPAGKALDHLCRNPRCVNPDHLEVVSQAENVRRGSKTRLTRDHIEEIRVATGPLKAIAEHYGVAVSTVSRIRRRERWS